MTGTDSEIVITGAGVVMPGCNDADAFWQHLVNCESQISTETFGNGRAFPVGRCELPDDPPFEHESLWQHYGRYPRDIKLYINSLRRAIDDSGLESLSLTSNRCGIYSGSSRGPFLYWDQAYSASAGVNLDLTFGVPGQAAAFGALLTGVQGPVHTFSNSCCSGAVAIDYACADLLRGRVDTALVSGHESTLCDRFFTGFDDAGILAPAASDPGAAYRVFRHPAGVVFAEAAVTLVLERRRDAEQRQARIMGHFGGYEYANHALHPTNVDPTADRPFRMIAELLERLDATPGEIGFVVGHGNGVAASDDSELKCMQRLLGESIGDVPLLSVKPVVGHSIGASSTASFLASLLIAQHGYAPAVTNIEPNDPEPFNFGGMDIPRSNWKLGLSLSYGIGGHHAVLAVKRRQEQGPS